MRTVSRRHAGFLRLPHGDAAVVAGRAAALAADVGRRVPVMLRRGGCAGRQRVGGKHRGRSWRRRGRSGRDGHDSRFGHVVCPLFLHNDGERKAARLNRSWCHSVSLTHLDKFKSVEHLF